MSSRTNIAKVFSEMCGHINYALRVYEGCGRGARAEMSIRITSGANDSKRLPTRAHAGRES